MKKNLPVFLYLFATGSLLLLTGYFLFCRLTGDDLLQDLYFAYRPFYLFQYFCLLGFYYALPYLFLAGCLASLKSPLKRVLIILLLLFASVLFFLAGGILLYSIHNRFGTRDMVVGNVQDIAGYRVLFLVNIIILFQIMAPVILTWVSTGILNVLITLKLTGRPPTAPLIPVTLK